MVTDLTVVRATLDGKTDWRTMYTHDQLDPLLAHPILGSAEVPYWKPNRLVISSDASLDTGTGSFGIVPVGHQCLGGAILSPRPIPHSMYAELVGIGEALNVAKALTSQFPSYREV